MRFIAVHPAAFTEEQLQPLAKEQLPEGVIWHATYCDFEENKTFCHWEAPTREALADLFVKYEIPYEMIHGVRHFDPMTAQLEPEAAEARVLLPT